MSDDRKTTVPVWTLATGDVRVSGLTTAGESMTAERLAELRGVLAVLADEPIVTLEVHPLSDKIDRGRGIPLDAASPPGAAPVAVHHAIDAGLPHSGQSDRFR